MNKNKVLKANIIGDSNINDSNEDDEEVADKLHV
jgi:hypothetical protein